MNTWKRALKGTAAHYIIALVIALAIVLVILLKSSFRLRINYINALTTGGSVCILMGGLVLTAYFGAFDIFGYAFKKPSKRRKTDYFTYKQEKKEKRSFALVIPYIVIGALFLLIGLLLKL